MLTPFLSVEYLCLDANLNTGFSFSFSLHLFYSRSFIEVSGSESSDGLRFCLVIVLLISPWVVEEYWFLTTGLWLLFPASKNIEFHRTSTRQCHQHLFSTSFPSEKVVPQCFISSNEPNSSHLPCFEQFSLCYSIGASCPASGFRTQPIVAFTLFSISP